MPVNNYYEKLSLSPGDPTDVIQKKLGHMQHGWQSRAMLAGTDGATARQMLDLIAEADTVFVDQAARNAYDEELNNASLATTTTHVPWQDQAWNYYYSGELVAAEIAAARARQADSNSVQALVLSATIELALAARRPGEMSLEDRYHQAQHYADNAMVLDDVSHQNTLNVHEIRGQVFKAMEQPKRAAGSFGAAMDETDGDNRVRIGLLKAACLPPEQGAQFCLTILSTTSGISARMARNLADAWEEQMERAISQQDDWQSYITSYRAISQQLKASNAPHIDLFRERIHRRLAWANWRRALDDAYDKLDKERERLDKQINAANDKLTDKHDDDDDDLLFWIKWVIGGGILWVVVGNTFSYLNIWTMIILVVASFPLVIGILVAISNSRTRHAAREEKARLQEQLRTLEVKLAENQQITDSANESFQSGRSLPLPKDPAHA
jgi:hypothetical protein